MLPWKDENGNREYIKIAKTQQSIMFLNAFELAAENSLKKGGLDLEKKKDFAEKSISQFFPMNPTDPQELVSRTPIVSSVMTYLTNYDTFRDREVSRYKGKVQPYAEHTNNTPELYKLAGKLTAKENADGTMSGGFHRKDFKLP